MKTIRQRITHPLIWSAILIPVAILLVFNIVMRFYMLDNARGDLKTTSVMLNTLAKQFIAANSLPTESGQLTLEFRENLDSIRSLIRTTSRVSGLDVLIVSQDGRILYPPDTADNLSPTVLARLVRKITGDLPGKQVLTLHTVSGEYLFIKTLLFEKMPARSPWIISVAQYSPVRGVLLTANLILLAILAAGSLLSIYVAAKTARRISEPLSQLASTADQIGIGQYTRVEPGNFSQEINQLQVKLNDMAERLANADHLQKAFLQDASHELRTPLMVIQGYAEGLEQGVLSDVTGTASIIQRESHKLSHLVDSLLTLSRIENQSSQVELMPLKLNDWLQDQIQNYQGLARKSGKELVFEPTVSIQITTSDSLLEQVLRNCLTNAIRYAAGKIVINTVIHDKSVRILIRDDGPGITAQDLPHIFDRFYKGEKGHYGLGLAIAKSAAEALGGRLTAKNTSDGGAELSIELPLI